MLILVTGCCGYIGSSLIPTLLHAGHAVVGVDNLSSGSSFPLLGWLGHPHFTFHQTDVCRLEEDIIRSADVIIHLAALVGEPLCRKHPDACWAVNRDATQRLVRATHSFQRILFPNTNSGYGTTTGTTECEEDHPLNPISDYAQAKCEAEQAVLDHPNSVSLRLATVFGPSPRMRFDLLVNHFVRALTVEKELTLFEPEFIRNHVHVLDVVGAFIYFTHNYHLRGVYNVGSPGENLSKMMLAHRICQTLDLPSTRIKRGEGHDPDQRNYRVSNRKLIRDGFVFQHTLDAGIHAVEQVCRLFPPSLLNGMSNV